MAPIDTSNWEQVGPQLATMPGEVYENPRTGERWYVKSPASERQRRNEVLASAVYRAMDFTAVEVHPTADGRVASKWIGDLPAVTTPAELRRRPEAFDAFLPSALVTHWGALQWNVPYRVFSLGDVRISSGQASARACGTGRSSCDVRFAPDNKDNVGGSVL